MPEVLEDRTQAKGRHHPNAPHPARNAKPARASATLPFLGENAMSECTPSSNELAKFLRSIADFNCSMWWFQTFRDEARELLAKVAADEPPANLATGCHVHGECPICKAQRVIGDPRDAATNKLSIGENNG